MRQQEESKAGRQVPEILLLVLSTTLADLGFLGLKKGSRMT